MARNRHRENIRGACLSDSTSSPRHSYLLRDFGVSRGRAGRNLTERFPDALLEGRATNIERQVKTDSRLFDQPQDLGNDGFVAGFVSDQIGLRKLVLQVQHERRRIISNEDGT